MNTHYLTLSLGIIFFLTSCSVENAIDRREDKLIGSWKIDKVIYDQYGRLFKKKLTADYRFDEFEFLPDHRVYYYDDDIGVEFEGEWEIVPHRQYDQDGDKEVEFYIEMFFYDPVYNDVFGYYGFISRLTRNKFRFFVSDSGGELEFRFKRK